MHKKQLVISTLSTIIFFSVSCYKIMFIDQEMNESKIELTAAMVFLISITMLYNANKKIQAIGKGIIIGLILSIVIFSLIWIFTLMYAFRNSD